MALVYTGDCSFGGVNFSRIQTDGAMVHDFDDRTHFAADDIPYSDDTTLQVGGRQSGEVSIPALVTAANLSALVAKRKQQGVLNLHGTSRTATLLHITNRRRRAGDYTLCDLTFYV
jgi:hypothetical protein